jgi:hypothetical protein
MYQAWPQPASRMDATHFTLLFCALKSETVISARFAFQHQNLNPGQDTRAKQTRNVTTQRPLSNTLESTSDRPRTRHAVRERGALNPPSQRGGPPPPPPPLHPPNFRGDGKEDSLHSETCSSVERSLIRAPHVVCVCNCMCVCVCMIVLTCHLACHVLHVLHPVGAVWRAYNVLLLTLRVGESARLAHTQLSLSRSRFHRIAS